jgi:hypothetical protein
MTIDSYEKLIDYQIQEYTSQIGIIANICERRDYWTSDWDGHYSLETNHQEVALLNNLCNERDYLDKHRNEIIHEWTEYYETICDGLHAMYKYYTKLNHVRYEYISEENMKSLHETFV